MSGYAKLLNEDNPIIVAINNNTFTTARDITSSTTQPPLNIGAYYLKRGDTIETRASGTFSTTGTPTIVFGTYFGSTVLGVNVAFTTASGAVTLPWEFVTRTTIYSVGSAGTALTKGWLDYGTTVSALTRIPIPGIALATVSINTTAAALWTAQATYSASSASNIIITNQFEVVHLNFRP
jgi:hypothetical protein